MKCFNFLLLLFVVVPSFFFHQNLTDNNEGLGKSKVTGYHGNNQVAENTINLNTTIKDGKGDQIKDTVKIWNGKKLESCKFILRDKSASTENLYKVENGFMNFSTKQVGYFYTTKDYSDFKLHAEWSWNEGQENANSGILLFIQNPDTVWPECIQVNYKENHAGDLIGMNGAKSDETIGKPNDIEPIHLSSSEKPTGQWNECDVIARGDSLEVYINGILQNKATHLNFIKGKIGFQLEGKPVKFRNMYLVKY